MHDDDHDSAATDESFLPDVTERWIGRITNVTDVSLTISATPREDRKAVPTVREFDRHLFRGRRKPRLGMDVAITEFSDGDIIIEPITHWWSKPFVELGEVALWLVAFLVALFQ